jgi:hypothetical protein
MAALETPDEHDEQNADEIQEAKPGRHNVFGRW